MVEKSDSFLREVEEDYRREQLKQLWDKYGLFVIGGVLAVLASVWGYYHMQGRRAAAAEVHGAQYQAALRLIRDGKADDAAKAFADLAKSAAPGYQGLAQLRIAALHAKAGRTAEATSTFDAIARDASVDQIVRDLAGVQAASLLLATADYAEIERRLTPLVADKAPWRTAARETLGLAAYKAGKLDEARKHFEMLLVDRTAPPGMNERVQLMLAVLTDADAAKAAANPAPATPPAPAAATEKTKDKSAAPPPAPKK
ncbi:MAG: tetratricopeptide repeat protein [Hyphomicrobiaceae bacterium]